MRFESTRSEIRDSPLKDELRSIYTFNAYVLGNASKNAFVEFAPRGGRNNYRISRQNMKYKHPAWSLENGFPEPNKDANGEYTSEGNFDGINFFCIFRRKVLPGWASIKWCPSR